MGRRNALRQHICIGCERVLDRGWERVLRRKPIAYCQRADAGGAAGLGHHAAVACDRARAIAAAMEEHENLCGITSWRQRPFGRNASGIDRIEADVLCDRRDRADGIEPFAPRRKSHGPRLGPQQRTDRIDFVRHVLLGLRC
jgi:hypothetical protein